MPPSTHNSRLTHRLAIALVCVVFPLIWVGGLVTTYDAGMAVPDWPSTYGYNLLLYPWTTWLAGPWNLFIEHGHRLLGFIAGLLCIALVAATFAMKEARIVRRLAIGALVLVAAQGALGGARVLFDARQIAVLHGCIGPLCFAYCACLAVVTSHAWQAPRKPQVQNASLTRSALFGWLLAYAQLVLGAFLRHPADNGSSRMFQLILLSHIILALALMGHGVALGWSALRQAHGERWIVLPALLLIGLLVLQLTLGVATLIAKYGWPVWLGSEWLSPGFVVTAQGFWSSMIVTAHVANGSLILAVLATLWIRCVRSFGSGVRLSSRTANYSAQEGERNAVSLVGGTT